MARNISSKKTAKDNQVRRKMSDEKDFFASHIIVTGKCCDVWAQDREYKIGELVKVKVGKNAGRVGKVIVVETDPIKVEPCEWEFEPRYLLNFTANERNGFVSIKDMFHEVELERPTKQERFIYEMGIDNSEEDL